MVLFKVKVIVFCLLQFSLLDATIVPGELVRSWCIAFEENTAKFLNRVVFSQLMTL